MTGVQFGGENGACRTSFFKDNIFHDLLHYVLLFTLTQWLKLWQLEYVDVGDTPPSLWMMQQAVGSIGDKGDRSCVLRR